MRSAEAQGYSKGDKGHFLSSRVCLHQDVDCACLRKVDLEANVEPLREEPVFLQSLYEEVNLSPSLEEQVREVAGEDFL